MVLAETKKPYLLPKMYFLESKIKQAICDSKQIYTEKMQANILA